MVLDKQYDVPKLITMFVILALMLLFYITSWISTAMTAVCAALMCIILRCCSAQKVVQEMNWECVIFLGGCLGLANGLTASGAGALIVDAVTSLVGNTASPRFLFAVIVLLTLIISQFITNSPAITVSYTHLQWLAALVTMIGASALSSQCVAYFTDLTGDKAQAALIYSGALGTLVVGKFILGVISDVIHIKRSAVVAPLFYAGVFVCLALCSANMSFSKGMIAFYMIGGAIPSVIPALITVRNFGDKEFGVMNGWMNMAGNVGQIIGPTVAAFIFDVTGTYRCV